MERFYDNDPDKDDEEQFFDSGDDDEDDMDDDDMDSEAIAIIDQQGIIDVMGLDLAQVELNQQLLGRAIEIASQGWFWGLKNAETRLEEIELIYKRLVELTDPPKDEE